MLQVTYRRREPSWAERWFHTGRVAHGPARRPVRTWQEGLRGPRAFGGSVSPVRPFEPSLLVGHRRVQPFDLGLARQDRLPEGKPLIVVARRWQLLHRLLEFLEGQMESIPSFCFVQLSHETSVAVRGRFGKVPDRQIQKGRIGRAHATAATDRRLRRCRPAGRSLRLVALSIEDIVARCQDSLTAHTPALAVRDVLRELVADRGTLGSALGPVERGGITTLHNSPDLTVLHVAWTPGMALYPHDHRMWAVIGLYGGQEDNAFFRRAPAGLEEVGGRELPAGEVLVLGDEVIHAVANSRREFAVALHVYGGDFFSVERSEWDPQTFEERPRDLERTRRLFEEANARWSAQP